MLLKRADEKPFQADFAIELKGGFRYKAGQVFNKVLGQTFSDDPINFDPTAAPYGPGAIDLNALGQYAKGKELDKSLAPIWGVDIGD